MFPALAVARCLLAQGVPVYWLGTVAGIENKLVPADGIALHHIDVKGIRGKGLATFLAAPVIILKALTQAISAMRRLRPGVALGMGGFVSGPGGIAAWLLGIPLVIHEQNAIPGLTNRLLAHVAAAVDVDHVVVVITVAQDGQPLDIPEPYHQASWKLIRKLVSEIGTAMAGKAG